MHDASGAERSGRIVAPRIKQSALSLQSRLLERPPVVIEPDCLYDCNSNEDASM